MLGDPAQRIDGGPRSDAQQGRATPSIRTWPSQMPSRGSRVPAEGGSFPSTGAAPGPAGLTWGRRRPLGCPRSLPPGWGWDTTLQKGHCEEVSRGIEPVCPPSKGAERQRKGSFSVLCATDRPLGRKVTRPSVSEGTKFGVYSILKPSPRCYLDDFVEFTLKGH